jgi:hypothetical protein
MITAAFSGSTEVAEELLSYFVDIGNKESVEINIWANHPLLPNKAPLRNQF